MTAESAATVIDTPAALMRRAADLIDARGWCQSEYQDSKGRYCMDGALGASQLDNLDTDLACWARSTDVYMSARWALTEHLDGGPIAWNDRPGRTHAEVTDALRTCAMLMEAGLLP